MASNNNIFYASNPAKMPDALWRIMGGGADDIRDMLIFLPSRRAVRVVEKMIAENMGGAAILPTLVALGEGPDDADMTDVQLPGTVSNMERVVTIARILAMDANIRTISMALPIADDLVRMWDYLENEGLDAAQIDWMELVGEKDYAKHFHGKAQILKILSNLAPEFFGGRVSTSAARNNDIRNWIGKLSNYSRVIVCASTASVPATSDLMVAVAGTDHGRIILPGKISGRDCDFALDTNPYNAEYKLLNRIGITPPDVVEIDVGKSAIDFLNATFGNDGALPDGGDTISHCHLVECNRESEEAATVAQIAADAVNLGKSVLVITPDAAGNQRIKEAFLAHDIVADFSGGVSGTMTNTGRALLNVFDDWIEAGDAATFDKLYMGSDFNLIEMIIRMVDGGAVSFTPTIDVENPDDAGVWNAIAELSDIIRTVGINPGVGDMRALLAYALATVTVRPVAVDTSVCVLGTIESRMQTADVVILTGLNDGMFPALGYENAWLPLSVAKKIGLPSPNRKVSLQSLDFMNLSCGDCVYWLRSQNSGGVQTPESRFLSRIRARRGAFDNPKRPGPDGRDVDNEASAAYSLLRRVRAVDAPEYKPLDHTPPMPGPDWGPLYVTRLETLVHNPYAFYVQHILKLQVENDSWDAPYSQWFGNLVHGVIEESTTPADFDVASLSGRMKSKMIADYGITGGILYQFWCRRFDTIADVVHNVFANHTPGMPEIEGQIEIAGRIVRARADRIWTNYENAVPVVMDYKTGKVPTKTQMMDGTMPQLPLTAYMLAQGGFGVENLPTPEIKILHFKKGGEREISYTSDVVDEMISASVAKAEKLIAMYSPGNIPYEYRIQKLPAYRRYDDLARVDD